MKVKLGFGILFLTLVAFFLFPSGEVQLKSEIPKLGEVSLKAIISPQNFDIPKEPEALQRERKIAEESVPYVFEEDEDRTLQLRLKFFELLEDIRTYQNLQKALNNKPGSSQTEELTQNSALLFEKITRQISQSALNALSKSPEALDLIDKHFNQILIEGVSEDFIAPNKRNLELYKKQFNLTNPKYILYHLDILTLIRGDQETVIPSKNIRTAEIRVENHFEKIKSQLPKNQTLLSAIYETLYASVGPNILFMAEETKMRQAKQANQILTIKGKVLEGSTIVGPGEIITQEIIDKLVALKSSIKNQDQENSKFYTPLAILFLSLLISISYISYLSSQHPKWLRDNKFFLALILIPTLQFLLISINFQLEKEINAIFTGINLHHTNTWYLTPFTFGAILATILFSFEMGLVLTVISATYFSMITGFDLNIFIGSTLTCFTISWQLRNIKYRSQFILAAILGSLSFTFIIITISLLRNQISHPDTLVEVAIAWSNTIITVAICGLIFIPLFEKIFKITTNLTLIELSDFNHPALRHISINAPSTFHHSIMVGNLAEKAVERIGGNPLLVRVMALYHDIGKTLKPEYFTENQKGNKSKHDSIAPEESSKIISDHVTQAISLAESYRLPPLIISGIPEHHGTGLIKYFYNKAQEQGLNPNKEDYQYGGPKPQRKETVALMVADAVEATTRSLKNPQPEELADVVRKVIQTRLYENQFDEADITLKELKEMEIGFLQALEGMFHTRIAYPKNVWLEKPEAEKQKK